LRLASTLLGAFLIAAPGLLTGCLVADSIEFDPAVNNPPTFVKRPGSMLEFPGETKFVKKSDAASWGFPVRVRDADVEQDLEVHSRLVTSMNRDPDARRTGGCPRPAR